MDIREQVYNLIEEQGGADYDQKKELAQELSEGNIDLLIEDLDRFYKGWFATQQFEDYTEERARLECIQETCFEVACEALALQGDPNVIPYFLKYVPVDEYDGSTVSMEDYNVQHLLDCISDKDYYGEAYIPVLLANIDELIPDKMIEAGGFFYRMILDDLGYFEEEHPFFNNLILAKKDAFTDLINYSISDTLEYIQCNEFDRFEFFQEEIQKPIANITYDDEPLIQIAYVRQQFLKLHVLD